MILQILTHPPEFMNYWNVICPQQFGRSNSRQLKQLRRPDGPCGKLDFPTRKKRLEVIFDCDFYAGCLCFPQRASKQDAAYVGVG